MELLAPLVLLALLSATLTHGELGTGFGL